MAAMSAGPRSLSRPLRWFLILVSVAGGVLAADKTWLNDLRFEFSASDWWSNITPVEMSSADIAIAPVPADHGAPQLSMSRLLHGLLFQKPSTGWRLEPEKTDFTSPRLAEQSYGDFAAVSSRFDYSQPTSSISGFVTRGASTAPSIPSSTDGTWTSGASGNWGTAANWQSNVIADGAGATAHFDLTNISSDVTVNLDTSRTIGNVYIGDTDGTNHYSIAPASGTTLTFDDNTSSFSVHSILQQTSTSAGDTIAANIF